MLRGNMGEGRQAPEDPGVADQNIELAEALIERGSQSIDRLAVGELERDERGFAARSPDRVVDFSKALRLRASSRTCAPLVRISPRRRGRYRARRR